MRIIDIQKRNKILNELSNGNYNISSQIENINELKNEYIKTYEEWQKVCTELLIEKDKYDRGKEIIECYKNQRLTYASNNREQFKNDLQRRSFVKNIDEWDQNYKSIYADLRDIIIPSLRALINKKRILQKKLEVLEKII